VQRHLDVEKLSATGTLFLCGREGVSLDVCASIFTNKSWREVERD